MFSLASALLSGHLSPSCLVSQYPATCLGQNTHQSFCFPALSCLYNSSDVSGHLPCILLCAGSVGALHTLSLSLPYEVDNVILILQPKKWSLREACVPKDTQLVNGETRTETADSDSRACTLARETTLPRMFLDILLMEVLSVVLFRAEL